MVLRFHGARASWQLKSVRHGGTLSVTGATVAFCGGVGGGLMMLRPSAAKLKFVCWADTVQQSHSHWCRLFKLSDTQR